MVQSNLTNMSDAKINNEEALLEGHLIEAGIDLKSSISGGSSTSTWHIPRPSLSVGRSDNSENGTWNHHPDSPSRGSTSSHGSNASTRSATSGTLLLTVANLKNLAALHPVQLTLPKDPDYDLKREQQQAQYDAVSIASSTHFTVVNGFGRPSKNYNKSWCARNHLTVLVCTMSLLFMLGLLGGIVYIELRARSRFD